MDQWDVLKGLESRTSINRQIKETFKISIHRYIVNAHAYSKVSIKFTKSNFLIGEKITRFVLRSVAAGKGRKAVEGLEVFVYTVFLEI